MKGGQAGRLRCGWPITNRPQVDNLPHNCGAYFLTNFFTFVPFTSPT